MVAQFSCTGSVCASPGQVQTEQFQYECNSDNTFTQAEISIGSVRTASPTATLQTPLNESCALCVLSSLIPEAGPDDHCVRKFHVDNSRRGPIHITFPSPQHAYRAALKVKCDVWVLITRTSAATGILMVDVWSPVPGTSKETQSLIPSMTVVSAFLG